MLKQGDRAPDATFRDEHGEAISLSSLLDSTLVLYFYPKDDTPGCTAEACRFRDSYEAFTDAGATVIGVSSDDERSHARFRERLRLPFRLLSDPDASARNAFGIPKTFGLLPGRATFVIGREGTIIYAFNSQFAPDQHVARALAAI